MGQLLTLRAGPAAARIVRERGLRLEDVDVVPGASGGPKWLVLAGLDRYLFGTLASSPRRRPLHLVGSSIGSFRLAALAQADPLASLARAHEGYVEQRYPEKAPVSLVTETTARIVDVLLGPTGADEAVSHPWMRLHVVTTGCRGLLASDLRPLLLAGIALAVAGNVASRRLLALQAWRTLFHAGGDPGPFARQADLPTRHEPLTAANLRAVLLASAAIPLVLDPVRIPGVAGVHRDGGVVDYHLDLDFGEGDGLVLYPHFAPVVVPGWFDKGLPWRRAAGPNLDRVLLIAPSAGFVAQLPGGKIPDRNDFYDLPAEERVRAWRRVMAASEALAEELHELVATGRLAGRLEPLGGRP